MSLSAGLFLMAASSNPAAVAYSACLTEKAKMLMRSGEGAAAIGTASVQLCKSAEPSPTERNVLGEILPDARIEIWRKLHSRAEELVTTWVVLYRTCAANPKCPEEGMPGIDPMEAIAYMASEPAR